MTQIACDNLYFLYPLPYSTIQWWSKSEYTRCHALHEVIGGTKEYIYYREVKSSLAINGEPLQSLKSLALYSGLSTAWRVEYSADWALRFNPGTLRSSISFVTLIFCIGKREIYLVFGRESSYWVGLSFWEESFLSHSPRLWIWDSYIGRFVKKSLLWSIPRS